MDTPTITSTPRDALWNALAMIIASLFGGLVVALVNYLSNRKESKARIHKTEAESDEIQIRASLSLGEKTVAWTQQMMKAQEIIISQDREIRALVEQNEHLLEENLLLRSDARKQIGGRS